MTTYYPVTTCHGALWLTMAHYCPVHLPWLTMAHFGAVTTHHGFLWLTYYGAVTTYHNPPLQAGPVTTYHGALCLTLAYSGYGLLWLSKAYQCLAWLTVAYYIP